MKIETADIFNMTIKKPADIFFFLSAKKLPDIVNIKLDYDMFAYPGIRHKTHIDVSQKKHGIIWKLKTKDFNERERKVYERFTNELTRDYISFNTFILICKFIFTDLLNIPYTINIYDHPEFPFKRIPDNVFLITNHNNFIKNHYYYLDNEMYKFVLAPDYTACYHTRQTFPDHSLVRAIYVSDVADIDDISSIKLDLYKFKNYNKLETDIYFKVKRYIDISLDCVFDIQTYKNIMLLLMRYFLKQEYIKKNIQISAPWYRFFNPDNTPNTKTQSKYLYLMDYKHIPVIAPGYMLDISFKELNRYKLYSSIIFEHVL